MLHQERTRPGCSQETLAVAAGAGNSHIRHLEHGRATPTLVTLLKLADALELAVLLQAARSAANHRSAKAHRKPA